MKARMASSLWRRLDAAFMAPAPAERLAVVRIVVGGFLAATSGGVLPATLRAHQLGAYAFQPVGVLSPLAHPPPWSLMVAVNVLAILAGLFVCLGWRHAVTGPIAACAFLLTATYRSSFGMIFHSENLLAMHAFVVAFAPAADALSFDARKQVPGPPSSRYGWPLAALAVITTAAYFMAGVAKLRAEGVGWAAGEFLRNQIAYDNVRKAELGAFHSTVASAALAHPLIFAPLATASLALEALAPAFLVSWRALRFWACAVIGFHLGILVLMAVAFPYPLTGAAFVGLFPAERMIAWMRTRRAAGRRGSASAA